MEERSRCLGHCGSLGTKMGQERTGAADLWLPGLFGVQPSPSASVARGTLVPSASVTRPWDLEVGAEKQEKWDRVMRTPLPIISKAPTTTKELCVACHIAELA